jgi:hypothetical protein
MAVEAYFYKPDRYVLNRCTKYLARFNTDRRHAYGTDDEPRDRIAEAWRFPVVDTYAGGSSLFADPSAFSTYNEVTFIYAGRCPHVPAEVSVIGTFATLYSPIPLKRVEFEGEPTRYLSVTYVVPKGEMHQYRFVVEGAAPINDPVNPQQIVLDNGVVWSRFFTESFTGPLVFERWELDILDRIATEILPFRTADSQNFLARFYDYLDQDHKESVYNNVYRRDSSVGEVNFVDNILAREEWHRLIDYKTCIQMIDRILRMRNPNIDPCKMDRQLYFDLYNQMASGQVPGWDYSAYPDPKVFLAILRRHLVMGAFSHPKYGGNAGAAGWGYLSERYTDQTGNTLFNWARAIETPLGNNLDYKG